VNRDHLLKHREVLSVEDWAEIRRLRQSEGMAIQAIARRLGMSRNTVKKALVSDGPPRYHRAPASSIVYAVEPQIRVLLAEFPDMPSTVIMERVGWTRAGGLVCVRTQSTKPAAPRSDGPLATSAAGMSPPYGRAIAPDRLRPTKAATDIGYM
jgi:hypothetical protein